MAKEAPSVADQFEDPEQQREVAQLGMWTFLATEILFFGGLFLAYALFRNSYPEAFAEGSRHTNLLFGTLNTFILLTSSLTMALAVHAAQDGNTRALLRNLAFTLALALGFLMVKGFEYHQDFVEHLVPGAHFAQELPPRAGMFFWLYWAMTGLHAIHVLVGIGILSVITCLARSNRFSAKYHTPVEIAGLYWHFVDLVWIFLYPLLYLIDLHA